MVSAKNSVRSDKIQYSNDDGKTWNFLVKDLPGDTTAYDWELPPLANTAQVMIKVVAVDRRFQDTAPVRGYLLTPGQPEGGTASCSPDFNQDGGVDIFDVQAFFDAFGGRGPGNADFNGDGGLDIFDIDAFFRVFGGGEC